QAGTSVGAAAGRVGAPEALEDVREGFGGNSLAVVGDNEDRSVVILLRGDADLAPVVIVVDGVGQQVCDYQRETIGIADTLGNRQVRLDGDAALCCQRANQFDALSGGSREIEALTLHRLLAGIKAGKFE